MRVSLARRNLVSDPRRVITSALGTGVALALILLLQGLWLGFQRQVTAYEDNVGADLFVAEAGTRSFLGESSLVPATAQQDIERVEGVRSADPILTRGAVLELHGRKQFTFVIASEPGRVGGPWRLAGGRAAREGDEAVIDESLARQHDVDLGSRIEILGQDFRVVGLSEGTRSWMFGFVFVPLDAARTLVRAPGATSFVLVRTPAARSVATLIEDATGLEALPVDQVAENDRALLARSIAGPLRLMVAIAFVAGTLIVALTVYSQVVDRLGEYGIVKAIGATRARLFAIVLGQTMALAGVGAAIALPTFLGAAQLVPRSGPSSARICRPAG
jgi:putative ABC transport system permease protein